MTLKERVARRMLSISHNNQGEMMNLPLELSKEKGFLNATLRFAKEFFVKEQEDILQNMSQDIRFRSFTPLPKSLLTFVWAEKERLVLQSSHRILLDDDERKVRRGNDLSIDHIPRDETHPSTFAPFLIEGYWIPESEGEFFSNATLEPSPFIKETENGREILFLVHPHSKHLFLPLREKYKDKKIDLEALALSSFRTLLVAYQNTFSFIKVSLDKEIGFNEKQEKIVRILSKKECALSVANTGLIHSLSMASPSDVKMEFLSEDFSFVPGKHLINSGLGFALAQEKGAGMIHRIIPQCLSEPKEFIVPLFALLGPKNRPMLKALIEQSGLPPTQCVMEKILKPLMLSCLELLFKHNTSIQAHDQNIMIAIDPEQPHAINTRFVYRDMGGVNTLLIQRQELKNRLPSELQADDYFYFDKHFHDAAINIDRIVTVAYLLTEQFFNDQEICKNDEEFFQWKKEMCDRGFIKNWTSDAAECHTLEIPIDQFYHFGYFEKKLAALLLNYFLEEGCFFGRYDVFQDFVERMKINLEGKDQIDPCIYQQDWFIDLIKTFYH